MRNVISFHRNTENVYIYTSVYNTYYTHTHTHHMLFIQSASRHLCVFMNLILLLWTFFSSSSSFISWKGHEIYAFHMFSNDKMMEHNCICCLIFLIRTYNSIHLLHSMTSFYRPFYLLFSLSFQNENFWPFELYTHTIIDRYVWLTFFVGLAFHGMRFLAPFIFLWPSSINIII